MSFLVLFILLCVLVWRIREVFSLKRGLESDNELQKFANKLIVRVFIYLASASEGVPNV